MKFFDFSFHQVYIRKQQANEREMKWKMMMMNINEKFSDGDHFT